MAKISILQMHAETRFQNRMRLKDGTRKVITQYFVQGMCLKLNRVQN